MTIKTSAAVSQCVHMVHFWDEKTKRDEENDDKNSSTYILLLLLQYQYVQQQRPLDRIYPGVHQEYSQYQTSITTRIAVQLARMILRVRVHTRTRLRNSHRCALTQIQGSIRSHMISEKPIPSSFGSVHQRRNYQQRQMVNFEGSVCVCCWCHATTRSYGVKCEVGFLPSLRLLAPDGTSRHTW